MSVDNITFKYVIIVGLCTSVFLPKHVFTLRKHSKWTYFVFAQRWPPAACLDLRHGKCIVPKGVNDWIIHGLWPTGEKGYPSFCNNSWPFNLMSLKPIMVELEVKWPNIMSGASSTSFWKHEWVKHGTCAASVEELDTELKYFRRTIELHDSLNIYDLLKNSNIRPTDEYPHVLKYIDNSLKMQLKKAPKILCENHKDYQYPLLTTIYFCMDKSFNLIDCDIPKEQSCNHSYVLYIPLANRSTCPEH